MSTIILVPKDFEIIAHRGASAYAPENTMPAFKLAVEMGVRSIELDTQLTADGVVVVCHDESLERYGHGPRVLEQMSFAELNELDMGAWFSPHLFSGVRMLTLEQLFAEFGAHLFYHIEIKGSAPDLAVTVRRLVEKAGLKERTLYTSFEFENLRRMRRCNPEARLSWLGQELTEDVMRQAKELNLQQICLPASKLSAELVARAKTVVSEVRAWGLLGKPQEVRALIKRAAESGCVGATLNWPDWAKTS